MPNYYTQISAFDSLSTALHATVNNIANINTPGYKAVEVTLQSGPLDEGVRLGRISRNLNPGPATIVNLNALEGISAAEQKTKTHQLTDAAYSASYTQATTNRLHNEEGLNLVERELRAYQEAQEAEFRGYTELSNVDLPREFVNLIATEKAYSANAIAMRTQDQIVGSLINMVT